MPGSQQFGAVHHDATEQPHPRRDSGDLAGCCEGHPLAGRPDGVLSGARSGFPPPTGPL